MAGYDYQHLEDAMIQTFLTVPYPGYNPGSDEYDMTLDLIQRIGGPIHQHVVSWWNEQGGGIFPDEMVKMVGDDPVAGYLGTKIDDDTIKYNEDTFQLYVNAVPLASDVKLGGIQVGAQPFLYLQGNNLILNAEADPLLIGGDNMVPTSRAVKMYVDNVVVGAGSGGDMYKSTYDTGDNGVVDDAEKLNNQSGSYYLTWANFTGTPTTLGGYGITDAYTKTALDAFFEGEDVGKKQVDWARILNKPNLYTVQNNADNRVITGSAGYDLYGEPNLTFNGSLLTVTGDTDISGTLSVDIITEFTVAYGIDIIDPIRVDQIDEYILNAGVTIEGVLLKDDKINWSYISGTPTTFAGYGISDTLANLNTALSDATLYKWEADQGATNIHGDNVIYGSAASTACVGNDARLSDSRTPLAHASSHLSSGGDTIANFTSTVTGLVPLSGGGTTKYLRADGTWVAPPGSGMVYPGAGIALSTGSAWGTSITNNSANWNTAYDHSQDNTQAHSDYMLNTGDTASGDYLISGGISLRASTTETRSLEIGHSRTGSGYAFIDLIGDATYTDYGTRWFRSNTGANASTYLYHRGTGDFIIQGTDACKLKLRTSALDRLTILSDGNVGIGTTSPTGKLELLQASDAYNKGLNIRNAADASSGWIWKDGGDFILQSGTNTNQLVLDSAATKRIGIGTKTPSALLDLKTTDSWILELDRTGNANINTLFGVGVSYTALNDDFMFFGVSGTNSNLVITDDGLIGINNTSPSYRLDVNGTGRFVSGLYCNSGVIVTGSLNTSQHVNITGSLYLVTNGAPIDFTSGNAQIYHYDVSGLWIRNYVNGGVITLTGYDTGGINRNLIKGSPDNNVELFYAGAIKLTTTSIGITIAGNIKGSAASYLDIYTDTVDTSDTKAARIGGGGDVSTSRGALAGFYGNEHATYPGDLFLQSGATGEVYIKRGTSMKLQTTAAGVTVTGLLDVNQNATAVYIADFYQQHATGFGVRIDTENTGTDAILRLDAGATINVFRVQGDGKVGIKCTPSYNLDVNGTGRFTGAFHANAGITVTGTVTASFTMTATNFILSSDLYLKENIQSIKPSSIDDIKILSFNFKSDENKRLRYGVIAQDLEKIHPEMVYENEKGYKQIGYIDFLLMKMSRKDKQIEELTTGLRKLEKQISKNYGERS